MALGKAGSIEARQIKLTSAQILSGTIIGPGDGGDITINAAEGLTLADYSGISAGQPIISSGNAGKIMITAQQIILKDGSYIVNPTLGTGKGGPITLSVRDALTVQSGNIHAHSLGIGDAGKIDITARQLKLTQGGEIKGKRMGFAVRFLKANFYPN